MKGSQQSKEPVDGSQHADGASWGSESDRATMAQFAAEIAVRSGYGVCAIEVLRADGLLEVVAVHGTDEGEERLLGRTLPYSVRDPVFADGATYGSLTFVAAEWLTAEGSQLLERHGHLPERVPLDHPDAWRNHDLLVARLTDESGGVRGLIHLDEPTSGLRPTGPDLVRLSDELHMTVRAVISVIEREELAQRVRLADAARRVIRQASTQTRLAELLGLASEQLRDGFRATELQFHLKTGEDYRSPHRQPVLSPGVVGAVDDAVDDAWRHDTVVVVEKDHVWGDGGLITGACLVELNGAMADAGLGLMVLVPIGTAEACLGLMAILRRAPAHPWTASEGIAAREVGHDLARAVLNARAHEREQELTRELLRLDRYRTQLVSTVTHELRNPLGVILGHLELLESYDDIPADWLRSLTAIGKAAGRLDNLAEDLLTLSRLDGSEHPPRREPVDMAEVVAETVELAHLDAERRGVTVEIELGHGPFVLLGDRAELARVVTNLLSNAIKYSDAGDRVVLGLEADAGAVVLFCRDEGLGISDADQAMMFEEFFRSTNHAALQRPGTGLGLPILRRVVERHGGRVGLTSTLGEGSTFTVTLPKGRS